MNPRQFIKRQVAGTVRGRDASASATAMVNRPTRKEWKI